ncbi:MULTISPECIES: SprT family zinc-dependent metalloprotease [Caldimonas]|uniref:M48 family metallopeptidase n=1 Tax=Caldimonas TaxID=196013 RepID=UPI0003804F14|nr:SprT family zinc-dependent metalloprotease [Caldimonas manganoxidans]
MVRPASGSREPQQLSLFSGESPSSATVAAPATPSRPEVGRSLPPVAFAHPRSTHELVLDGHRVAYVLRRAKRRTIGFVVGPEGLTVSAPRWVSVGEIEAALREKARWVLRKLAEQNERNARLQQAKVEWRDGASLPFLGETVIVVLDPRATGAVLHTDADALPGVPRLTLHVGLPQQASAAQIRDAVHGWLQRQARRVFEERCGHFAQRLGVRYTRLSLSSAQTRWGSASADGSIRLNWRLIHFALPIIDYVVAHELAHLREMNHSPRFWDVVRSVLPDYEHARGRLKETVLPDLG